jgi:serine/threonine protein kinase
MLNLDPANRITLREALDHPWLNPKKNLKEYLE